MVFPECHCVFVGPTAHHPIVAQETNSFILKNPVSEPQMSKKTLALAALTLVSGAVFAQAAPATTLTFNAGVVTDYRYRGITQSRNEAAVQGGVDYAHKSGFYVGAWAPTAAEQKPVPTFLAMWNLTFTAVTNSTCPKT
jgi:hypothetical protein